MKKIVNPSKCAIWNGKKYNAFAKIIFEDGKLSISGVIGPKSNGNCYGGTGQCVDEISKGTPTKEWTDEMLQKFCDIWKEYHLNDMRPYCEHQKALGWREIAKKKVTIYNYTLTHEAFDRKRAAEKSALDALRKGETFTPTEEQIKYAILALSFKSGEELSENQKKYYELKKATSYSPSTEEKILGWTHPEEHPEGILGKPCPVCGYKYGTSWKKEEVPEEIIKWLFDLPETKVQPAWV